MTAQILNGNGQGSCPHPVSQPPFYGAPHLTAFNMNGMFTKINRGKKKVRKYVDLAKYLVALSIYIACIQEHHVTSQEEEDVLRKRFERLRYCTMLNYHTSGRGP